MTDVKDCASRLREFAAEPDTPKSRNSIDACIDHYRATSAPGLCRAFLNLRLRDFFESETGFDDR